MNPNRDGEPCSPARCCCSGCYGAGLPERQARSRRAASGELSLIEAVIAARRRAAVRPDSAQFEFKRGNPAFFRGQSVECGRQETDRYELDPGPAKSRRPPMKPMEKTDNATHTGGPAAFAHHPDACQFALAQEHSEGHARSADIDRRAITSNTTSDCEPRRHLAPGQDQRIERYGDQDEKISKTLEC